MQQFALNGQLTNIEEAKNTAGYNGKTLTTQAFDVLQHDANSNEVARRFTLGDKYSSQLLGFAKGDHVRVFFTMATVKGTGKYPTTFFNAFKIEAVDKPERFYAGNCKPEFDAHNNTPR